MIEHQDQDQNSGCLALAKTQETSPSELTIVINYLVQVILLQSYWCQRN